MFDIHAGDLTSLARNLDRMCGLLERLVDACERIAPPILPDKPVEMAQVSDLHTIDDRESEQVSEGKRAVATWFGVVPDSEAFEQALAQYEQEMRRVYGEGYKFDWEDAYKRAAQASGIGD